jgi:hypothetical protein
MHSFDRTPTSPRVTSPAASASERGQGTIEYVGLILLVSLLMVGMVAAMKGSTGHSLRGVRSGLLSEEAEVLEVIAFRGTPIARNCLVRFSFITGGPQMRIAGAFGRLGGGVPGCQPAWAASRAKA